MKKFFNSIIISILIILPLIFIILFCYELCNIRYVVKVNNDNIDIIKHYFNQNDFDIDDNVKEIILALEQLSEDKYYIIYNNEIKTKTIGTLEDDKGLSDYIIKNNENNRLALIAIAIPISIIVSSNLISKLKKGKTKFEETI